MIKRFWRKIKGAWRSHLAVLDEYDRWFREEIIKALEKRDFERADWLAKLQWMMWEDPF